MQQTEARHPVRVALDLIYKISGYIAAIFLLAILVLVVGQMVTRWAGGVFVGGTNYAGYCMAAASFFALAYALNHGAHIRVSMVLNKLGRWRRAGELWCFVIGSALAIYFAYYSHKGAYLSYLINDVSQGQDATPLWIPQIPMALGTSILALALVDHFVRILFFGAVDIFEDDHLEAPD